MCHVKSTPYKVFMASFKKLKIDCLEIHAASVRSSLMSCLSCFCSVKLSGSLLPPVPLFDQTLRHIAYRAMSSMNHYGGIYWNEPLWRYLLKWTIMEVSIENCAFESQWKSESSRHLMGWKSIIWCIFIISFTLKYLSKSESVHENPLYATFSKYEYHSSSETIMISKILLHTLLYTHWPLGPLRSNHIIWWWKVVICWKVTMWWKVTINLQYKKDDDDGVSSYDVITSLMMTNRHDNAPIILLSYKGKERAVQSPQL